MNIERRLKHTRAWFWVISSFITVLTILSLFYYKDYYQAEPKDVPVPVEQSLAAKRLPGKDPIEVAIAVSQNIYPATFADNKPGAVILVPNDWMATVLATEIIHSRKGSVRDVNRVSGPLSRKRIRRDAICVSTIVRKML